MTTFTVDLGDAPDGADLAVVARAIDMQAHHQGRTTGGAGYVQCVQAIGNAVAAGGGPVEVDAERTDYYRVRDLLDDALAGLDDAAAAVVLAVLGQWDAFAGWDAEEAERRDDANGQPGSRARTVL